MSVPVLRISGLSKSFRGRRVVDSVDMTVEQGQIVGFLGPNGAGKTSVMSMIVGLVAPDEGEISLFGENRRSVRTRLRLGYLQEKPTLYPDMTARAYLMLFARLHGVPQPEVRVDAVLDRVGLTAAADRSLGTYSRGMQQRASLARVMLHAPEFLILDEPTLGLDPRGMADMRDIFREMRDAGVTLLFSSHQLAEIERICDEIVFLTQGRVIAAGTPADLLPDSDSGNVIVVETAEPLEGRRAALEALPGVEDFRVIGAHRAALRLSDPAGDLHALRGALARALFAAGLTPLSVSPQQVTLEDLFLTLAGPRPGNGD
jgi:ABC-type multidrug transport system ATPase subunit